jgi:hypothetical protein
VPVLQHDLGALLYEAMQMLSRHFYSYSILDQFYKESQDHSRLLFESRFQLL